jgi:hypothetical protein
MIEDRKAQKQKVKDELLAKKILDKEDRNNKFKNHKLGHIKLNEKDKIEPL